MIGVPCISILAVLVGFSLSRPLFRSSSVVVFLDRGHPCFWNLNSTVPIDVATLTGTVTFWNCGDEGVFAINQGKIWQFLLGSMALVVLRLLFKVLLLIQTCIPGILHTT